MYCNYRQVVEAARAKGPAVISVAVAQDREVLEAVKLAYDEGIASAILVGDAKQIKLLAEEAGLPSDVRIVNETDNALAALKAVSLVHNGEAQVLMKGLINSSEFLRAVLNKDAGLRTGRLLSHLAVFEIPRQEKLLFVTDGGMNIAPSLEEKKDILINAMLALNDMGLVKPHVAVLTANELVNPKMPATVDAKALADMSISGALPPGIVEGPIALDVAVSAEAACHKNIASQVAGKVDLMLVPNIETGNAIGKTLIYYAGAKMAGLVLGAATPVIMTSRAETAEGKLNSIALACLGLTR